MSKLLFSALAIAAFSAGAMQAQDLTGSWQGTLQTPQGQQLRTIIQIAKDGAGWKSNCYSIDQTGQPFPANTTTFQDGALKVVIASIAATYEGKLDSDGAAFTGSFKQGASAIPLTLRRPAPGAEWEIPKAPAPKRMADANPEFDAATIKPSRPEAQGVSITFRGSQMVASNTTLSYLMGIAYSVHAKQILAGPAWLESDHFDITGKLADGAGAPDVTQLRTMIHKLLAERFGLVYHLEKREQPVYAIQVAKTGPKILKSASDPNGLPGLGFRKLGDLVVTNATLADFAVLLQSTVLDRPVVDQTGLTGKWDFTLLWTPDEFQFAGLGVKIPPPPPDAANAPPTLFTACQEQLGLRLEATKATADAFVIDKVTKPTEN